MTLDEPTTVVSEGSTVENRVLCVDLDGSLLATDLLYESFLALLRWKPLDLWRVPLWICLGKAQLKRRLAERVELDVRSLPVHEEVVDFLRQERSEGRQLVLVTAAEERLARAVADHMGLFDDVIASDGTSNLKGRVKLQAIEARFGRNGFDYIGNDWEDLLIWKSSGKAIVVRPGARLLEAVRSGRSPVKVFERTEGRVGPWLRMLRPHQWAKNILLFVPLITSHRLMEWSLIVTTLIAFLAFSLGASAIYILNDLMDLPSDRLHPHKKRRPLASGRVGIPGALAICFLTLGAAIGLAILLPPQFLAMLLIYLFTSMAYTFVLKQKLMIDVLCLAGLYTLRIVAGGAATGIPMTMWLLAFSVFLFLSLAFVKRYGELAAMSGSSTGLIPGRGYMALDADMIRSAGTASGYLSVLVVCLYIHDGQSAVLYHHPEWLWLVCPALLYWISRIWFLAQRGQLHSDPVIFTLVDWRSWLVGIVCAAIAVAATVL
jgi:4-hydroxybenzoate polyprenyltransferase/phosphoserine phosphatase